MAGVAFAVEGDGVGFATESYAASALYTMLASLSGALWRIRRVRTLLLDEGHSLFYHGDIASSLVANSPARAGAQVTETISDAVDSKVDVRTNMIPFPPS
jgi:hypothetical protein